MPSSEIQSVFPLFFYLANDIITTVQLLQFVACINPNAYRHALLYLYEITCGIVDRNQRESTACGIADTLYHTCIFNIRNSIGSKAHLIANLDIRHLRLLVVGLHPFLMLIDNAHHCLTRVNQLSHMNILAAHHTIASGNDVAIREVQSGYLHLCPC